MWLGKSSDILLQSALMGFECDTRRLLLVSGLSVINPTSEKKTKKNKVRFGFEEALNENRFIRIYPLGTPNVNQINQNLNILDVVKQTDSLQKVKFEIQI